MPIDQIDVIIPAYNQGSYLHDAVQSVLSQSHRNFNLIVVDDGSTDETPQVLDTIHDPRMRVIRQPNSGLSAARNTGLRNSSAPYVTFLDADDRFLPDKLEVLSQCLESDPHIGVIAGKAKYINQFGRPLVQDWQPTVLRLPELLFGNPICVSGVMLRRKWLDTAGTFNEDLHACEDWDLWLRLLSVGCQMEWKNHFVVEYRLHSGQMTGQCERMQTAMLRMMTKFFGDHKLPQHLYSLRKKVFATCMVHSAAFAYFSSEFEKGADNLAEAIRLAPELRDHGYRELVASLVAWSNNPRFSNPAAFLEHVITWPPKGHRGLIWPLRRALADALLAPLFDSTREVLQDHARDLFRVIMNKPDWLLNRGVLRLLIDAWL